MRHLIPPCSVAFSIQKALVDFSLVLKVVISFRLKEICASDPASLFFTSKEILIWLSLG